MDKLEKMVADALVEHARVIDQNIKNVVSAVELWLKCDPKGAQEMVKKIRETDEKASAIKDKILADVAEAKASISRTDFLRLILQLDQVGSYSEGAAVRLGYLSQTFCLTENDEMVSRFRKLGEAFLKMGEALKMTIRSLSSSIDKINMFCSEIGKTEKEVDAIYRELEFHLFSRQDFDIRLIFYIRTIALHIEEAADNINNITNSVRIIVSNRSLE